MTMEQRMDQLEKRNKRLTVALTMMAVAMCAVVTMAATGLKDGNFDTVTARKILVKNVLGEVVVTLGSNDLADGLVEAHEILLWNNEGRIAVELGARGGGPGTGYVSTYSIEGKRLVQLTESDVGDGAVVTRSAQNGNKLVEIGSNFGAAGLILVNNIQGRQLVQLGPTRGGDVGSILVGNGTEVLVSMDADEYGNGMVGVWNRKGKGRTLLQPGP